MNTKFVVIGSLGTTGPYHAKSVHISYLCLSGKHDGPPSITQQIILFHPFESNFILFFFKWIKFFHKLTVLRSIEVLLPALEGNNDKKLKKNKRRTNLQTYIRVHKNFYGSKCYYQLTSAPIRASEVKLHPTDRRWTGGRAHREVLLQITPYLCVPSSCLQNSIRRNANWFIPFFCTAWWEVLACN